MCDLKGTKPDYRCQSHLCGSTAAKMSVQAETGEDMRIVNSEFSGLRKEGKHLPAPAPEEVKAHIESEIFRTKHNLSLQERRRNAIIRNWEKAREEKPDGATMHAWRNLLTRVFTRYRRTVAAVGVSSILLTACSPAVTNNDGTPPPSSSVVASAEASARALDFSQSKFVPSPSVVGNEDALADAKAIGVDYDYLPVKLAPNDKAWEYDASQAAQYGPLENFTKEETEAMHKANITYLSEVYRGSPFALKGKVDDETSQSWSKQVLDKNYLGKDIYKEMTTEKWDAASSVSGSLLIGQEKQNDYTPVVDRNTPLINGMSFVQKDAWENQPDKQSPNGMFTINYDFKYDYAPQSKENGKFIQQHYTGTASFTATREAGKIKVIGLNISDTKTSSDSK